MPYIDLDLFDKRKYRRIDIILKQRHTQDLYTIHHMDQELLSKLITFLKVYYLLTVQEILSKK